MTVTAPAVVEDRSDLQDEAAFDQYVTFFLDQECFAFPMAAVREIIRVPRTVEVPLTPPGLVGLANLRGAILPVIDLRVTLGLAPRAFDDTTRAVVVDCGRPIGLIVDRVSNVLDIEAGRVERSEQTKSFARHDMLTGVVKGANGQDLIQLLDAERTVAHEFGRVVADLTRRAASGEAVGTVAVEDEDEDDGTLQLVSLLVGGQEYAFEIGEVDEIVRVPSRINEVPHAADHVLGLINLRARLLPLVSLRRIFALPEEALNEHHRIVVVRFVTGAGRQERVGVVVDHVREVLRVGQSDLAPMPPLLASAGDAEQISTICQLEGGQRLVGLLSSKTLFQHPALREASEILRTQADPEQAEAEQEQTEMGDEDDDDIDEQQLVVYQVADQEYGVKIKSVQEIIRVPDVINKVPGTPDYIEGMINLRGVVLPVAAMRGRFALAPVARNDRQRVLVFNVGGSQIGFIVDSVSEVLRVPESAIEPAPDLSPEQRRLIGTVANLDDGRRMILVLNADELLSEVEPEPALV